MVFSILTLMTVSKTSARTDTESTRRTIPKYHLKLLRTIVKSRFAWLVRSRQSQMLRKLLDLNLAIAAWKCVGLMAWNIEKIIPTSLFRTHLVTV